MWKTFEAAYPGVMAKVWDAGVANCCHADDALPVDVFAHFEMVSANSREKKVVIEARGCLSPPTVPVDEFGGTNSNESSESST